MSAVRAEPLQLRHALALLGDESRALDGALLGLRHMPLKNVKNVWVHNDHDSTRPLAGPLRNLRRLRRRAAGFRPVAGSFHRRVAGSGFAKSGLNRRCEVRCGSAIGMALVEAIGVKGVSRLDYQK